MPGFMRMLVCTCCIKVMCSVSIICVSVPDEKLEFQLELALVSSQAWVMAPKHLCMWSGSKLSFFESVVQLSSINAMIMCA